MQETQYSWWVNDVEGLVSLGSCVDVTSDDYAVSRGEIRRYIEPIE